MRSLLVAVLLGLFSLPQAHAVENPLFGYTHLLPSPFTLPAGKFFIGSSAGIGITDFLQVETNVISDIYEIYNARARLSLLDFPGFAVGLYLGYQNVNLKNLSDSNPSIHFSSWMPGGTIGIEVLPNVAWFLGGNLFYANTDLPSSSTFQSSGFLQGSQIETDVSWAYNPHGNNTGNVLSGGFTYNTTFEFYGVGVSHHWKGFQLGIHYYPNANNLKVYPIASVGATFEI
jgi:hypothetical protein